METLTRQGCTMSTLDDRPIWIALVGIAPGPQNVGLLASSDGAYVNVVGKASNAKDLRTQTERRLSELGLRMDDFDDAEPLVTRRTRYAVDANLVELAEVAAQTGQLQLGEFFLFPADAPDA